MCIFYSVPSQTARRAIADTSVHGLFKLAKPKYSTKENTLLGNNGINLSGGQRQRISIARELYKEVDILIMDEATSSLDSETEMTIQQNLDQLKGKYTIITIAHRLSTIKNTDEIVIMDKGNIVEKGSYNNLINSESIFRKMINLQKA